MKVSAFLPASFASPLVVCYNTLFTLLVLLLVLIQSPAPSGFYVLAKSTNCTTISEQIVGPYWVNEDINKADLRSEFSVGVPLDLTFRVVDAQKSLPDSDCIPIANARIDLWQCRHDGLYSDEAVEGTLGEKWLRGYQITNESGYASFYTIFPGWYRYRTVHLHLRVRLYSENGTVSYDDFTQLYFDDAISDAIFEEVYPYNSRGKTRDKHNSEDHFFTSNNVMSLSGSHKEEGGYKTTVDLSVPFLPRVRKDSWLRALLRAVLRFLGWRDHDDGIHASGPGPFLGFLDNAIPENAHGKSK